MKDFNQYLTKRKQHFEKIINDYLFNQKNTKAKKLYDAICYTVLNGGKRIRPLLVYATGETLGANLKSLDPLACAIEFIHTASLIHDDLPAMDNDDLRRGQPTCHKKFDQATAILAGDTLLTLGFTAITNCNLAAKKRLLALNILTQSCGLQGIMAGQALDIDNNHNLTQQQLIDIHNLKTGSLFKASMKLGAIVANATRQQLAILNKVATNLGLIFQIQDDIFDASPDDNTSFVTSYGAEKTNKYLKKIIEQSFSQLKTLLSANNWLLPLTKHIIQREF